MFSINGQTNKLDKIDDKIWFKVAEHFVTDNLVWLRCYLQKTNLVYTDIKRVNAPNKLAVLQSLISKGLRHLIAISILLTLTNWMITVLVY